MKFFIFQGPSRDELVDVADPLPGAGDVVVKVRAALKYWTELQAVRQGQP